MVLGARASHHDTRVVARCRHHSEHFACLRVDGYDAAYLSFHQPFAQSLQLKVDREREVLACHGLSVVGSVHVFALYSSAGVAQQYLYTLLSAQLLLIVFLHTELAYVVAGLIIVVLLNVGRRHFGYIAEDVRTTRCLILAYAAVLDIESRKPEHLLLKVAELLVAELTHEELLRKARVTWVFRIVLDVVHALYEEFLGNAKRIAELGCVDTSFGFVHYNHNVVCGLVVHQQLTVAIIYCSTRRKLNLFKERVGVSVLLIVVAH